MQDIQRGARVTDCDGSIWEIAGIGSEPLRGRRGVDYSIILRRTERRVLLASSWISNVGDDAPYRPIADDPWAEHAAMVAGGR